jgi:peptidoglycan L-alanyl-D-glutamate endopeptidase CwlK
VSAVITPKGFTLSHRSLARLVGVHPKLVAVVKAAVALSKIDFTVIEGVRSYDLQRRYFLAGKSRTMRSKHLTGHAVDLMPWGDFDGDGVFEGSWDRHHFYPINDAMQQAAANLKTVVTWGGNWVSFPDCPHWEISPETYPWPKEAA